MLLAASVKARYGGFGNHNLGRGKMDIQEWQNVNLIRSEESFGNQCADWSEGDWGNALAGEVGELCNLIKKHRRGEYIDWTDFAEEIGGVASYLALVSSALGIDLQHAMITEFNKVSEKVGSVYFLPQYTAGRIASGASHNFAPDLSQRACCLECGFPHLQCTTCGICENCAASVSCTERSK